MPRDSGGTYTLVSGNPVLSGTIIASTWANTTMDDLASAMTDSLSRTGNGAMLAPMKHTNGSESNPSITFNNDPLTGRYLAAVGDMRDTVNAQDISRQTPAGMEVWIDGAWQLVQPLNSKAGRKNLVINGSMDIWQRGAGVFNQSSYSADRMLIAFSRSAAQSTDVPLNTGRDSKYSLAVTGFNGADPWFYTSVELPQAGEAGVFSANKKFTLSFWGKFPNTAYTSISLLFADDVLSQINAVSIDTQSAGTGTGAWEKYVVTFDIQSVTPAASNLALIIGFRTGGANVTSYFRDIQLEEGSVATEFEYRPIAEELALCQRYYEKSYNIADLPASAGSNGIENFVNGANTTGPVGQCEIHFKTTKRGTSSVDLYANDGTLGEVSLLNSAGSFTVDISASGSLIGDSGFRVTFASNASSGVRFHWTADAEL